MVGAVLVTGAIKLGWYKPLDPVYAYILLQQVGGAGVCARVTCMCGRRQCAPQRLKAIGLPVSGCSRHASGLQRCVAPATAAEHLLAARAALQRVGLPCCCSFVCPPPTRCKTLPACRATGSRVGAEVGEPWVCIGPNAAIGPVPHLCMTSLSLTPLQKWAPSFSSSTCLPSLPSLPGELRRAGPLLLSSRSRGPNASTASWPCLSF